MAQNRRSIRRKVNKPCKPQASRVLSILKVSLAFWPKCPPWGGVLRVARPRKKGLCSKSPLVQNQQVLAQELRQGMGSLLFHRTLNRNCLRLATSRAASGHLGAHRHAQPQGASWHADLEVHPLGHFGAPHLGLLVNGSAGQENSSPHWGNNSLNTMPKAQPQKCCQQQSE